MEQTSLPPPAGSRVSASITGIDTFFVSFCRGLPRYQVYVDNLIFSFCSVSASFPGGVNLPASFCRRQVHGCLTFLPDIYKLPASFCRVSDSLLGVKKTFLPAYAGGRVYAILPGIDNLDGFCGKQGVCLLTR
jgi:hypothetical protein